MAPSFCKTLVNFSECLGGLQGFFREKGGIMSCELDASELAINKDKTVTLNEVGKAMIENANGIGTVLKANVQTRIVERLTLEGIELVEQKFI